MKTYDSLAFKYVRTSTYIQKMVSILNVPHICEVIGHKKCALVDEEGEKMLDALLLKPPLTLSFKNYVRPDKPLPAKKFTPGARMYVMGW